MILADKIMRFRKKNGWSQEELAAKMNVSRQAVSKWESAQSTPDLEKILQLSYLFCVTTDYLLKDEIEDEMMIDRPDETPLRRITLAEANEYLEQRKDVSVKIAIATFLCIICPIPLFLLIAISGMTSLPVPDHTIIGIGVIAIFPIVAIAVSLFIRAGFQNAPYDFLENNSFETEYGVTGLAKDRQKGYRHTYIRYNYIGACGCILSPVPLLCGVFGEDGFLTLLLLCMTMLIVGISVMFFIIAGVRWTSLQRLLKEGEFAYKEKQKNKIIEAIGIIYWLLATAIYLAWSFLSGDWHITWVVWVVAGVLFAVIDVISHLVLEK